MIPDFVIKLSNLVGQMLIDLSLNILKNYEPNSIVEKQKSSLEYLHYLDPKQELLVIRFGIRYYEEKNKYYNLITFKKSILNLFTLFKFQQLLLDKKGVIVCHGFGMPIRFMALKLLVKKRFNIYVQHHAGEPFQNPLKLLLQRTAYKNANGYFFTSKENAEKFVESKIIKHQNKVTEVMEGSCSFTLLDKRVCRKHLGISDELVFIWVGRLNQNKDPFTVLNAFERFVQIHKNSCLYMIFGTDELKKEIEYFVNTNDLTRNVKLNGKVDHQELEKWYNASDIYLSGSHTEGSGYALCEALACGCYPVITNIPSFNWMTGNGKVGKQFSPGNSDELLRTLNELDISAIETERDKTRKHFDELLSFEAIAKTISTTINQK